MNFEKLIAGSERAFILTNEVLVTPLMALCLEHFFNLADIGSIIPGSFTNVRVTRMAPSKDGCRYNVTYSYVKENRRPGSGTLKYMVHPITKTVEVI